MAAGAALDLAKKVLLCGEDGPSGAFTTISAHIQGIYYASKGDGPNAAKAAAGLWGGLSGGVIGFIFGGPLGAFIGGSLGSILAGQGAKAIVEANLPKELHPEIKENTLQIKIDDRFLGNYRRQPSIKPAIDNSSFVIRTVDGHNLMYWNYEGLLYPVSLDLDRPRLAFVHHSVGGTQCLSEFSLNKNGDIEEWNPQKRERWLWKRE